MKLSAFDLAAQRTVPGAGIGGGALGVSGLQVQEVARRDERQVQLQTALDGPAVLVGRTPARTRARDRGVGGGDVEGIRRGGGPQRGEGDVRRDRRDGERRHEAGAGRVVAERRQEGAGEAGRAVRREDRARVRIEVADLELVHRARQLGRTPGLVEAQGADEVGHAVALHHVDQARDGRQAGHRIEGHAHRRDGRRVADEHVGAVAAEARGRDPLADEAGGQAEHAALVEHRVAAGGRVFHRERGRRPPPSVAV